MLLSLRGVESFGPFGPLGPRLRCLMLAYIGHLLQRPELHTVGLLGFRAGANALRSCETCSQSPSEVERFCRQALLVDRAAHLPQASARQPHATPHYCCRRRYDAQAMSRRTFLAKRFTTTAQVFGWSMSAPLEHLPSSNEPGSRMLRHATS